MSANRILVILTILPIAVAWPGAVRADEGPAKHPELKALEPLVGTWGTEATIKVAEWSPQEVRTTGSVTCAWVLGGHFVQGKGTDSLKSTFLPHWTYDANQKAYRNWFFNSEGAALEWGGKWDPDSKTFVLKQDLGNGITDTLTVRLVGADAVEFTSEAKGRDGKVYFAMDSKWTRRK
jgi:hypothetical protein